MFPTLVGKIKQLDKDNTLNALSLLNFDPRTKQCEQEVQKYFVCKTLQISYRMHSQTQNE